MDFSTEACGVNSVRAVILAVIFLASFSWLSSALPIRCDYGFIHSSTATRHGYETFLGFNVNEWQIISELERDLKENQIPYWGKDISYQGTRQGISWTIRAHGNPGKILMYTDAAYLQWRSANGIAELRRIYAREGNPLKSLIPLIEKEGEIVEGEIVDTLPLDNLK